MIYFIEEGLQVYAWMKEVLTRIPDHKANRLHELLPIPGNGLLLQKKSKLLNRFKINCYIRINNGSPRRYDYIVNILNQYGQNVAVEYVVIE